MANRFKVQTTTPKKKVNRFIVAPQTTKTTTTTPKTTPKAPALQPGMSTATIEKQNAAAFAKFGVKAPAGAPKMSIPPTLGGPKIGFEFKSKDVWGENYQTPRADFSNEKFRQTVAGPKPLKDLFGNAAGQVNHVVPVALGGTGTTKNTANLDWREDKRSLLQKILKSDISFTKAQQSGRVLVETANIKDFQDGKITQGQAIANILAWDEANGQGKANQLKRTNPALASQIKTQAGQINNKFFPDSEDVSLAKLADQNPVKIAFSVFGDKIKKGIEAVSKGVSFINQKNIEKLNKGGEVAKYGLDGLKNFVTNGLAKAGSDLGYLFWDEMDKPVKSKSIVSEKTRSKLPPAFQKVTDKITNPSDLGGNLSNLQKQTVGKLFKNTDFDQKAATGFKDISNYFEKKSAEKYVGLGLNEMKATDPRKIAWNVGQGGGSMALAIGTSVLTANPTIGVAVLTAVDTSGEYKAARDAGKTREEALNTFLTSTAGTFISEKVGMDMFFKTMGGPLVVRALKHAVAETAQEESQQWWQNLVAKKGYDESRKVTDGMLDVLLSTPFIGMWGAGLDNNPTIKALNDQQLKIVQEKTGLSETDARGFLDSAVKINNQQQLELAQNLAGIMKANGKILSDALNSEEGFARIPGEQTKVVDNLQLAEKGVSRVLNDFATKVDYRISGEFNKATEIGNQIRSIELGEIDSPGKLYSALKEEVSKLDIAPDLKTKITASLKESVGDYFTMLKGGETSTLGYEKVSETTVDKAKKYKQTINIQDKEDLEYLGRILSKDNIEDIKNGKMTNFRGKSYEDLARVNIVSETPQTSAQKLEGKIRPFKLSSNVLFHGTTSDNLQNILSKGFKKGSELSENAFRGGGYGATQDSISFSTDPKIASNFTGQSARGVLFKTGLKPNAKVVEIKGITHAEDLNDFISELLKQKIDAVYIPDEKEIVVINKSAIDRISEYKEFDVAKRGAFNQEGFVKIPEVKVPEGTNVNIVSLENEARKYKTAEEFVKAQNIPEQGKIDIRKLNVLNEKGFREDVPKNKAVSTGAIEVVRTDKGLVIVDGHHRVSEAVKAGKNTIDYKIVSPKYALQKYGYDIPDLRKALYPMNPKLVGDIKTQVAQVASVIPDSKSQLIDIWNKANTQNKKDTSSFSFKIDATEAIKRIKDATGLRDIELYTSKRMPENTYGRYYIDGWIQLLEKDGKVSEFAAQHEGWHLVEKMLPLSEIRALEDYVLENYKEDIERIKPDYEELENSPRELAQEVIADQWAYYNSSGKGVAERLLRVFSRAMQKVKNLVKNRTELLDYFKTVKAAQKLEPRKATRDQFKKEDAKQFVEARKYRQNKLKEALEGPLGEKLAVKIETNQYERSKINQLVVGAIKKTPYYRKEKGVLDMMGEGIFYGKAGQNDLSLAYTPEQIKRAKASAFDTYEVDSMAATYGFESGYEFLVDQLERSELPRTTDLKKVVEKELLQTDKSFEKATEIVEGVKGKTVKLSTYLNEKAFSDKIKSRRERLEAIRDYLQLSDDDVRRISRKDIRFMNDYEFEQFLKNFDSMAVKYAETKQAKLELLALINDREFKNWDNLRQANGFKKIDEMSVAELRAFEKALEPYQFGDEFLSVRKLETIDNTDLVGLKTLREVKQRLAEDIGISVENFDKIEVSFLDKFKGDTTLARKNAFFNFMVDEYNKSKLQNDYDYLEFEKQLDELGRAAEKSVGLTLTEKIVPQQKIVMAYLEATEANRLILAEKMTKEEIDLAVFLQNEYQKALAYLIQQKALFSSRFDGNYFVHIRRGILEEIKEDGIVSAVKNIFSQYKENEQNFKILDDDTQNILPLEKFFKFSLFRSGEIKPTQNVIEASKAYFRMLYTKKALDSMIPKVDIYAQVLTPKEMTPQGLEMDRSLKKFVNEWVNNKKGRKTSFGGVITQGGPADIALRSTKMFTSLLDLGLNLPVSVATYIGEATAQFPLLGAKNYALGVFRKQTSKGKRILAKYQNFTGRSAWDSLIAPGQGLFDRSLNGIFIGFRDSAHRANTFYLLGSMTRQEFMSEKISDERLSELKKNLGKYRIVEGAKSIIGSTSLGSAATQYKSWAIPIFSTTINNFKNVIANKSLRKESAIELARTLEILAVPLIIGALLADKDDDKGFINKLKQRALTEAMSLYGALNLKSLLATPRIYTLLQDFVANLGLLIKLEEFKTGENAGNLKGAQGLKKQFTPRAVKQITENMETGKKWQIILDRSKNEPIDDETKATFKEELKAYYEEELDKIKKSKEEVEFKTEELNKTINNKIKQFKNNQFDLAAEKAFKKLKGLAPAEREAFFNTLPKGVQTRIETIIKNEKKKQLNN